MEKREKILVGASIAAVVFALLYLPGQLSKKKTGTINPAGDANVFVATMIEKVSKDSSEGLNEYVVHRAITEWKNDPFLKSGYYGKKSSHQLNYDGYVRSGNTIIAIVNGIEYGPGEVIKDKNAVIKFITPQRVVIVDNKNRKFILPLKKDL